MKRRPASGRRHKRQFTRTAKRTKKVNISSHGRRGGYRM